MACLGALWRMGKGTVREVADAVAPRQVLAYTTVMTLLERLVRRGQLKREKLGRSFVYSPTKDPRELQDIAVSELARDYFGGSRESLRQWLDTGQTVPARSESEKSDMSHESIDTALL